MFQNIFNKLKNPGESLRWRTTQGFIVVVFGDAYQNLLRLGGNLIMTRLLFPEAFGLMLITSLVFTAIIMFSDAGIKTAIMVNKRAEEPDFINTAWTLFILRGIIIAAVACAAAYPVSVAYSEPILFPLILVLSLSSLIRGFSSPYEAIYDRDVKKVPIIMLDAIAQTVGLVFAILWLLVDPSVWALVGMGIMSSTVYTVLSFFFFKGPRPSFRLEKSAASEILHFGKWIVLSTALTFMGSQGDKLIVSNFITTAELGLFSIAIALAKIPEIMSGSLCWKLLLPVYTELKNKASQNLAKQIMKVELLLFVACFPFIFGMTIFGSELIDLLYDERYANAGWMLQAMALGTMFTAFNETQITLMMAYANSRRSAWFQSVRVALLIVTMGLAAHFYGLVGLVYSISLAPALFYVVLLIFNVPHYKVNPMVQLACLGLLLIVVILGWSMNGWPVPELPPQQ